MMQCHILQRLISHTATSCVCPHAIQNASHRKTSRVAFKTAMVPGGCSRLAYVQRPQSRIQAVQRVPSTEAAVLLDGGLRYLDVRTPEEYAAGHAVGAINIPFWFKTADGQMAPNPDFVQQVRQQFPDAEEQIIVGCRSGNRSAKACAVLEQEVQYSNLIDDAGGWLGWVDAKLPVQV